MDELINAMSDSDLADLKTKYADNPSLATLIDGILETRTREQAQVIARTKFEGGIAKFFNKLPHPDDIHNVYAHWGSVEVATGEPEEVEVPQADGSTITELRTPTTKVEQWIVETNHIARVVVASGQGSAKVSKRAITLYKRNGTQLEEKGHFASANKACDFLKVPVGGDSATRVLAREGYILEPYAGMDFSG